MVAHQHAGVNPKTGLLAGFAQRLQESLPLLVILERFGGEIGPKSIKATTGVGFAYNALPRSVSNVLSVYCAQVHARPKSWKSGVVGILYVLFRRHRLAKKQ